MLGDASLLRQSQTRWVVYPECTLNFIYLPAGDEIITISLLSTPKQNLIRWRSTRTRSCNTLLNIQSYFGFGCRVSCRSANARSNSPRCTPGSEMNIAAEMARLRTRRRMVRLFILKSMLPLPQRTAFVGNCREQAWLLKNSLQWQKLPKLGD